MKIKTLAEKFKENREYVKKNTIPPCDKKDCIYYDVEVIFFGDIQYRRIECLQCKYFERGLDNHKPKE